MRTSGIRVRRARRRISVEAVGVGLGIGPGRLQHVVGAEDDGDEVGLELERLGKLLEHLGAGRSVDREVAKLELRVARSQQSAASSSGQASPGSQPVPAVKLSPSAT